MEEWLSSGLVRWFKSLNAQFFPLLINCSQKVIATISGNDHHEYGEAGLHFWGEI